MGHQDPEDLWSGTPGDMSHSCHYPGCKVEVAPKLWGCRPHWFKLPKRLRDAIWQTYVPGQEIRKDPSDEYLAVAELVQRWCRESREA